MLTILVTGLSPGNLATAVALKFSSDHEKYKVYGVMRNISLAEQVYQQAKDLGVREGTLNLVEYDLSLEKGCTGVVRHVLRKAGCIDILVNHGSFFPSHTMEELPMEKVHECFEDNLFTHWRMIKSVLPSMKRKRFGRIINLSPAPLSNNPSLCASKAATESLAETTNISLCPFDIYINSYAPRMIIPDSGAILDSRDVGKDSVDFPSVHNAASHVDNPPDTNDLEDTALMNLYCQAADEVVSLFDSPPARMRKIAHAKGPVELKPAEIVTLNHEQ